ncbi:MAG TPA: stage III sporulation protein AD [Firmicutes bacterium]|nr:stage III sporulation protein AD [Bacillota bacterium]
MVRLLLWLPLVIGLGVVLTIFQAHLREEQPPWAVLVGISFVVVVFLALIPQFTSSFGALTALAREAQVSSIYLNPVLKTIGVAYLTSFGVQISREAGEEAISGMIELAGKLVILLIALPLLQAILYTLFGILGF